ncbi:TonB-dependent receptor plug domain-containing protein [Roseovarius sp. ZX-A-9]|uniref:TonB-dependent receptor plug domain-containing protein n=1 Tax=Roseovarius sp. ZX-A-9 TaxID=3014783 RepID=UPI00232D4B54|nr:TonB-dependent receptor [Roseovarius sp. ZX-A-9]
MTRQHSVIFATATAMLAAPALAEEVYDLGTIVVSGSLSPTERSHTGATVEVLQGEDAGSKDTSVIGRLDRLPGVNSASNGGLGGATAIQIRGLPAKYVGVRINGIDMADPSGTQTQFDFGGLTASGIGRIEVLKGSQSALYGSEAIAGVVSITTFQPEELGFSGQATTEAGSFGTYSGSLSLGYRSERGFVAFSYGRIETDGISAQSFNTEKDGFEQSTTTLSGEYDISDTVTIGGALIRRDGKVEIDRARPGPFVAADATGANDFTETGARVFSTIHTGAISHTLAFDFFDIDRKDPTDPYTIAFSGERRGISYLGTAELTGRTTLNFGISHTEEKYGTLPGPNPFADPAASGSEDTTSVNAELLFAPTDTLDISAALRYDDNSSFGGKTTGRLAAVWRPVEDLAFRASVGSGYRAPSLYERFGQYGDPTIQPEESISYDFGVEKSFGAAGYVKAMVFYADIDDLIDFDGTSLSCGNPFPGCYNQVPGTTTSKGIELSGEYLLTGALTLYGAYTYTDASTDGKRLARVPKHDITLGLTNDFTDRFSGYVDVRHVADVVPSAAARPTDKVGDYTLVGAGVSYDVTASTAIYLRIENLFDEDYETAGGYNQPGRAAYVGLRANF